MDFENVFFKEIIGGRVKVSGSSAEFVNASTITYLNHYFLRKVCKLKTF